MDTAKIKTTLLLKTLAALVIVETAAMVVNAWMDIPILFTLAAARIIEAIFFILLVKLDDGSLNVIGLKSTTIWFGLKRGLIWSAGFGVAASILFVILYLADNNPLTLIRSNIPGKLGDLVPFLLVGGIIAPIAEEIFFRGIVYRYLRRLTVGVAIILSSVLFATLHLRSGLPVIQFVGGLVFAVAFEKEKSLMTPITIHVLGNLAIFTLSTPWIQGVFVI